MGRRREHCIPPAARLSNDPKTRLSKSLSWLLRHAANNEGFTFEDGGFLYVDDILRHKTFRNYTVEEVEAVVTDDVKQRYTLRRSPHDENRLQIRANQGHSVEVHNLELTEILDASEIPLVIHGTYREKLAKIKNEGLSRMNRNHVHFFTFEPHSREVISGARKNCDVFIYIDAAKAMSDGLRFFRSSNGVILCPGNNDGIIKTDYFEKITIENPE